VIRGETLLRSIAKVEFGLISGPAQVELAAEYESETVSRKKPAHDERNTLQETNADSSAAFVTKISDSDITIPCVILPPPIDRTICP
jgi:hypothetical protein